MSKKNKTILLVAVAAVVWGYAGLKWFNYFSVEGDDFVSLQQQGSSIPDMVLGEKKEFVLNADYQDPFLKNRKYKPSVSSPVNHVNNTGQIKKVVNPLPVSPTYKWPALEYSGFILSHGEKLGLLKISDQDILAKKGDVYRQINIVGIYSDSISLSTGEHTKTILKK